MNAVVGDANLGPDLYGSTESTRADGKLVSALVTWDSKITTVVALLGGVGDLVRPKMKRDHIYNDFIAITKVGSTASDAPEIPRDL